MDSVCLILPARDAGEQLIALVDALHQQSLRAQRLIVIDSSQGKTPDCLVEKYGAKLVAIDPDNFDHGASRNLGIQRCDCELVVFLTDDVLLCDDDTLGKLIEPLLRAGDIAGPE